MKKVLLVSILFFLCSIPLGVEAAPKKMMKSSPAKTTKTIKSTRSPATAGGSSMGGIGAPKTLEIRGQSRNLNMLLILKNPIDQIDFIKPKTNYKEEIGQTNF
jgi:hypothetical protein